MTDFLNLLDGPERPAVRFDPKPPGRDVSKYGAAALAGEVANIQAVPIGSGRNDQLNRSAVKMGGLIAAGAIDEQTVTEHLGAADGGLDYPATRATIASGLRFGMQQARAIPDRGTPSEHDSGRSDDPFSDSYIAPAASSGPITAQPAGSNRNGAEDWATAGHQAGVATATASNTAPAELAAAPNPSNGVSPDDLGALVRDRLPVVDWYHAWQGAAAEEWIIEPLIAARRLVAIYSAPKVGKSLLLLELAYHISCGTRVLGVTPSRAYRVLYVDFENDLQGDIVPRLTNIGADPTRLDNLQYLNFPTIAGLDSEKGARELMAAIQVYDCEVVIIDTVSRSVDGEENDNDTWLKFYRQTGLRLKQAGVAMVRLDHSGKDETKGQRGGSAKGGDIDAVWRLTRTADDHFTLYCDMSRFPIPAGDKILSLIRRDDPLRHVVDMTGDTLIELAIKCCDDNDLPNGAGFRPVRTLCAEHGIKIGQRPATRVAEMRQARETPATPPSTGDTP